MCLLVTLVTSEEQRSMKPSNHLLQYLRPCTRTIALVSCILNHFDDIYCSASRRSEQAFSKWLQHDRCDRIGSTMAGESSLMAVTVTFASIVELG